MKFGFHHVHVVCSDLDTTETFYIDTLGARFIERTTFGDAQGSKLSLGKTGLFLRVAAPGESMNLAGRPPAFGYHHIGVSVADLEAIHSQLTAKGVVFTVPPKQTPGGRMAFIQGPDNIIVELFEPTH